MGRATAPEPPLEDTWSVEPTADEVRRQLERIVASPGFANADRMSAFLRYVVEQALSGEAARVKEYAIGVEVFGRDQDYDPRLDSIVRVEARRLRAKVDEYYAGRGADDPVLIRLRRGTYVPTFEQRAPAPIAAAPQPRRVGTAVRIGLGLAVASVVLVAAAARSGLWATTAPDVDVAVLPFVEYSSDPADVALAARLTDGVTGELARLGSVGVVSHLTARQYGRDRRLTAGQIAAALDADLLIEGTVTRSGEQVDVVVRLVSGTRDRKMWADSFAGSAGNLRELERRIAQAVAPAAARARPER
jgi:TolB-like protein